MMVMTAKVNIKKIILALAAVAGVIIALILLLGGGNSSTPTAAPSVAGNDGRVQFLQNLGWEVSASPVESGQVRIPQDEYTLKFSPNFTISVISERILRNMQRLISRGISKGSLRHLL